MANNVVFQFCNPIQKPCKNPIREATPNHGITPSIELKYVCIHHPSANETLQLSHLCAFFCDSKSPTSSSPDFHWGQGTLLQTAELVASSIGVSNEKNTDGPKELNELTTHGVLSIIVLFILSYPHF